MLSFQSAVTIWSFRKELKYVVLGFLCILAIPVFAVVVLTNTGINVVSDKLATVDKHTNTVEIHNPLTNVVTTKINAEMEWPITGIVTLEFGMSDLPYQPLHTGIDIADPHHQIGTPVVPFMEGTVTYAGEIFWGYGKHVIIDHGNGVTSLYGHLNKIYVYKGQHVHLGEVIGERGSTGWSTGPHLHFQIDVDGIPVNPHTFLGMGRPAVR